MGPFSIWELRFPRWLIIFLVCSFCFMQSSTQIGFLPSVIPTLQTAFGLTSRQTGSLISAYDFATLLAVTHVGHLCSSRAPRFMGLGMGLMGLGIFLFASSTLAPSSTPAYAILLLAQVLFGLGASPLYVIGPVYLAANLSQKVLSVALGLFYATSALGPAAGFVIAGVAISGWHWWAVLLLFATATISLAFPLSLCPLDFRIPGEVYLGHEDQRQQPQDEVIYGEDDDAQALEHHHHHHQQQQQQQQQEMDQLGGFEQDPSSFGDANEDSLLAQDHDGNEGEKRKRGKPSSSHPASSPTSENQGGVLGRLSAFIGPKLWKSLLVCLREPTFLAASAAISSQTFCLTALTTFIPLFVAESFSISAGTAAILMGVAVIPGAAGGIMLGGYITKRLNATIEQHIKLTYISTFLAVPLSGIFFLANQWAFLSLLVFLMAAIFIGTVSANTITMRAVPEEHRGLAVGVQSVLYRLLGAVPGPVAMGAIIDHHCVQWEGNCLAYDIPGLRKSWFLFSLFFSLLTGSLFFLQLLTWRARLRREAARR